jgi:hypothetical protein
MPESMHNYPINRIDHFPRSAKPIAAWKGLAVTWLLLWMLPMSELAAFPDIRFKAASIEFQGAVIQAVNGNLGTKGDLVISADQLVLEGRQESIRKLELGCPQWQAGGEVWCPDGEWTLEFGGLHADKAFSRVHGFITKASLEPDSIRLSGSVNTEGLAGTVLIEQGEDGLQIEVAWSELPLEQFQNLSVAPPELQWISRGNSTGSLTLEWPPAGEPDVRYAFELADLSFDSPEGRFAAESLQIASHGSMKFGATPSIQISGRIKEGELLLDDFYRDFSDAALDFAAHPVLDQSMMSVRNITATDNSALQLEGSAQLNLDDPVNSLAFRIRRLDLDFPGAYERYIEPLAGQWTLNGLGLSGGISWSGDWIDGAFESGALEIRDLTVVDQLRGRFAVTGLEASLRPGDHDFDSRLSWRGLLLGRINLGAGEMALDSKPGMLAISEPLELQLLGGSHVFHELGLVFPGSLGAVGEELDIMLRAELNGLDMEQLTAALDWPAFSGVINGEIPGVGLKDGVFSVDGEIIIEVFDGRVSIDDLSIERPFGVLPSLAANVDIHNLDLERLTQTFSFGQISGRLDGYIHDLRLLDWKPVAFDAWLGTPARQEKSRGISRQAVNRLTAIGGGNATAALTGPIMKMFNNFSYRRLGLGCRLHNNICDVRGISEDDVSVLIMEGAGLPKIMIRAFNRSLDWPQLVGGLMAVSSDEPVRIGDKP